MADEFRWRLGRACAGYPNISPSSVNVYTLQLLISTAGGNDSKQGKLKANQVGKLEIIFPSNHNIHKSLHGSRVLA